MREQTGDIGQPMAPQTSLHHPPPAAYPDRAQAATVIIRKNRGIFGGLLAGIAALIAVIAGWRMLVGEDWLAVHRESVHVDRSHVVVPGRDNLKGLQAGEVALVLNDETGRTVRVAANRQELENFEREILFFLKRHEEAAVEAYQQQVKTAFDQAFADSEASLDAYADWFFEWKRSWILMKEAIVGGASEALNIFSPGKIWEGVTGRVRDYLMENYESRVLQPDKRQPILQRELHAAFDTAHARFRKTIEEIGAREAAFIREQTRLLEPYAPGSTKLALDWGAQKWKIPAHLAEDRAEDVYRSVAIMGTAVAVTPLLAPIIRGVGQRVLARVAGRVVVANGGKIVGAYLGAETLGLSLIIGAIIDYGANLIDEKLSRENFISEHRTALTDTREGWETLVLEQLKPVVAGWYDETRQAVVLNKN